MGGPLVAASAPRPALSGAGSGPPLLGASLGLARRVPRRAARSGYRPPAARRGSLRAAALRLPRCPPPAPLLRACPAGRCGLPPVALGPLRARPCALRAGRVVGGPLLASARPAAAGRCGAARLALAPPARALCGPAARPVSRRARASLGLGCSARCGGRRPLLPVPTRYKQMGQRPRRHTRRRFNKTAIYFVE